jgi:hypothetical protein
MKFKVQSLVSDSVSPLKEAGGCYANFKHGEHGGTC